MERTTLIALTPPGLADPAIAIAASRAGELGVLDLGHTRDPSRARQAIETLARLGSSLFGVRLAGSERRHLAEIVAGSPERVATVVLDHEAATALADSFAELRDRGHHLLLEVTSGAQADFGVELGVDGLIAKGNESAGWVGEETSFVLLQRLVARFDVPIWVRGGIGLHSAAAAMAAGAAGVVLDSQLFLTRESRLPQRVRDNIRSMDGSETVCLGEDLGKPCRFFARTGMTGAVDELRASARELVESGRPPGFARQWQSDVEDRVGWGDPSSSLWPLGQDAAFAAPLAEKFETVAGVLRAMRDATHEHLRVALETEPLRENNALAASHGTRYPVVQGPMTRVSDRASFAKSVATGGGLPFLALALMRGAEVETLLSDTAREMGERPWGVGILGFVPLALRQEQLEVVRKYGPPFALIAGGRPDQARSLERDGIKSYLHVPSPGLLDLFLKDGARRFVFEGRECGGHVGPRSSFVLWNLMIDKLIASLPPGEAETCHVLFAGGIHDALSASMVSAMAAPLVERGVKVGVLLGTAYLFTEEAVEAEAIVRGFQKEALACTETVTLETGTGHATRCANTAFARAFKEEKQRLLGAGKSPEEIREALEMMNIGRLRVASKGLERSKGDGSAKLVEIAEDEQHTRGMYMIGQVAALRDRTCRIEDLHRSVSVEATERLRRLARTPAVSTSEPDEVPNEVAIVGMSSILPKAPNLAAYWQNILDKVDAITEIPKDRWDWEQYYDSDPRAKDKIYSKWGGFLEEETFDPIEFGMPPNSLRSIDPMQLLALKAARQAIEDAGYRDRPFDRSRASVILGASGGTGDLGSGYLLRSSLPLVLGEQASQIIESADGDLPEWTEDSFAGLLLNVAAGRIANRFDFGGFNYVVDAACASSLAAVHMAVRELEAQNTDFVIVGGVDTTQNPFGYLCFSKTHALSPTGRARTFDAEADGIAISEGLVMLVLKRLADAERDGDRVYAVIRGTAGSSDGRAKGMTAPRPEGQVLALRRAYRKAGFSPKTVGLFEAHGTGTVVGDRTEALSLSSVLEEEGAEARTSAVGSVKSMIGHTKATAGVASLAKVALALYSKVLPPTLGVTKPNPKARLDEGPLYVNSETRPWVSGSAPHPRRAGVSSFGFGGTNFHAVLEEYTGDYLPPEALYRRWPSELFLFVGSSRKVLISRMERLERAIGGTRADLVDLAHSVWCDSRDSDGGESVRVAIVASSIDDLKQKLADARARLVDERADEIRNPKGIYFQAREERGKIAFLFPGQGSQYPNMLRDLAIHFPEVREQFEIAERALSEKLPSPLGRYVFPPPAFEPEEERAQRKALTETNVAQPALGAADVAMATLLGALGVEPEMTAGHSYGEYVALSAAGVFDVETLARLSEARGRSILEAAEEDLGTMAAVEAAPDAVRDALGSLDDVWVSNYNAPRQTIVSGTRNGIDEAMDRFSSKGLRAHTLPVACAFHSPIVAPARMALAKVLGEVELGRPRLGVFSNVTGGAYPEEPAEIGELLARHLEKPVMFSDQVRAMYEAGARTFVEVGPRNVLTGLTDQILGDRPHLAVATDRPGRSGLTQLQHALGQLAARGVPVRLERLFQLRNARTLSLEAPSKSVAEAPSSTTWLVNGGGVRPYGRKVATKLGRSVTNEGAASERPILSRAQTRSSSSNGGEPGPRQSAHASSESSASVPSPGEPTSVPTSPRIGTVSRPPHDAASSSLVRFQDLMSQFLETQRSVMNAYLRSTGDEPRRGSVTPSTSGRSPVEGEVPTGADAEPPASVGSAQADPAPARTEKEAPSGLPSRERLQEGLLAIVGERTGYPSDMLELDVDIEAELGIDSIKRVEILGTVQRSLLPESLRVAEEAMEELAAIRTLGGIVDWLDDTVHGAGASKPRVADEAKEVKAEAGGDVARSSDGERPKIVRAKRVLVDAPVDPIATRLDRSPGVFLVTDDEKGVGDATRRLITERGGRSILLRDRPSGFRRSETGYDVELSSPASVHALVEDLRERGETIAGVLHLAPLGADVLPEDADLAAWRARTSRDVKGLFYLLREGAPDLKKAVAGHATLIAAVPIAPSADGGAMRLLFPPHAGIRGLIKSLAREWPEARSKSLELEGSEDETATAETVLSELAADDDDVVEVVYRSGKRQRRLPRLATVGENGHDKVPLDGEAVVLMTGGARGITAEVAIDLARRYRPRFALLGRSPEPAAEDPEAFRGLEGERELKAAIIAELRSRGEAASLADVEARYQRLVREREIRRTLTGIRELGATARYYRVDVRDERDLGATLEAVRAELGRIDLVVHGAGVIEDKLLEAKTPESFDRVFDTKVDGAYLLGKLLAKDAVKAFVFFGSAAGTFGNRGQCDYAAANEALNEIAAALNERVAGRVVSMNWGPWEKKGMVTSELRREFEKRGIELVPVDEGCRLFDRELRQGDEGDTEIVVAGGAWGEREEENAPRVEPTASRLPLVMAASLSNGGHVIRAKRTLDPARDLYLADHRIDGVEVLPMAMATELMTEVAQQAWPELTVVGVRDLQLFKGVVLDDGPRDITVVARPQVEPSHDRFGIDVHVELRDTDSGGKPYYRATVELADRPPEAPRFESPLPALPPFELTVEEAYRQWLFHGPRLQGITHIEGLGAEGVIATLEPSLPGRCLRDVQTGEWLIDPVVFDSALQLFLLWARANVDKTPLPSRFTRFRRFAPMSRGPLECHLEILETSRDPVFHINLYFLGPDGGVLGVLEEMEGACTKALNRLGGSWITDGSRGGTGRELHGG